MHLKKLSTLVFLFYFFKHMIRNFEEPILRTASDVEHVFKTCV